MPNHRTLHEIFLGNGDRVIHKWFHYFDIYEKHFARFVGTAPVMLEIGVFKGGSVAMWKEYFGPGTQIIGLDIDPDCAQYAEDGVDIVIGSQDDPKTLDDILSRHDIDIVLDDGSHMVAHQNASFRHLYDRISANGVYMVEDLHSNYLPDFGGGLRRKGTFIETVKHLIDDLHALYPKDLAPNAFTKSTGSISIYDSVVVFEKARQGARKAAMTGSMDHLESDVIW